MGKSVLFCCFLMMFLGQLSHSVFANRTKVEASPLLILDKVWSAKGCDAKEHESISALSLSNVSGQTIDLFKYKIIFYGADFSSYAEIEFPSSYSLKDKNEIWISENSEDFLSLFGKPLDFQTYQSSSKVPQMKSISTANSNGPLWRHLENGVGAIAIALKANGRILDFVPFEFLPKNYKIEEESESVMPKWPAGQWQGPLVRMPYLKNKKWRHSIMSRDRLNSGLLRKDRNKALDWDSSSFNTYEKNERHRFLYPGQSDFFPKKLKLKEGYLLATSAPDNNFAEFIKAIKSAKTEILVSVYQITNEIVVQSLLEAKRRGVKVILWLEGTPVGGIPNKEVKYALRMLNAGVAISFLERKTKKSKPARYHYDHSKYTIIDRHLSIIGTENYGSTGLPVSSSWGNRGWMVHIDNKKFASELLLVWKHDFSESEAGDIIDGGVFLEKVRIKKSQNAAKKMKKMLSKGQVKNNIGVSFHSTIGVEQKKNSYLDPMVAVKDSNESTVQLVLSPDNSLSEGTGILGMINSAKHTLFVEQNSIIKEWRGHKKSGEKYQHYPLEALVKAARRGVKVRVLLDSNFYNTTSKNQLDNDNTVAYLREIAFLEGLDMDAKLINLASVGVDKIHAKGIIADKSVFVGSINWTFESFTGNREVGVVIENRKIYNYYRDLFQKDWLKSEKFKVSLLNDAPVYEIRTKNGKPEMRIINKIYLKKGQSVSVFGDSKIGQKNKFYQVKQKNNKSVWLSEEDCSKAVIEANEGMHVIGDFVTYNGYIQKVVEKSKMVLLYFGSKKHAPLMGVFYKRDFKRLFSGKIQENKGFESLYGLRIKLNGRMERYFVPQIKITRSDQIEFLGR